MAGNKECAADTLRDADNKKVLQALETDEGRYLDGSRDIAQYANPLRKLAIDGLTDEALSAWRDDAQLTGVKRFINHVIHGDSAEMATHKCSETYRLSEEQAFGNLDDILKATPAIIAEITLKITTYDLSSKTNIEKLKSFITKKGESHLSARNAPSSYADVTVTITHLVIRGVGFPGTVNQIFMSE